MGNGWIAQKIADPHFLMTAYRMTALSARSLSTESTFNRYPIFMEQESGEEDHAFMQSLKFAPPPIPQLAVTGKAPTLHRNSKQVFPEMKLRSLVPNFCIHLSVSDFIYSHDRSAYYAVLRLRTDRNL
jgi:hypothetical protein